MNRYLYLCLLFTTGFSACAATEQGDHTMKLEQSVCGLKEPLLFWLWSSQAGSPNEKRLAGLRNVVGVSFKAADGRILRGYQLAADLGSNQKQTTRPKGYLLVIQGNAMLADQILAEFRAYADAGYDVFIYDYRGYGRSEGKRRIKAIVNDYKNLIASLNAQPYEQRLVYAMSLGGIVLLDALTEELKLDRVVIDSSPSRLSDYGCPDSYDPVNHLPDDCSNFMFVAGEQDRIVNLGMSKELLEKGQQRGARIRIDPEFSHPFMDMSWSVHKRRMNTIKEFMLNVQ
jgi:alpha/beta superfamily hydrolase